MRPGFRGDLSPSSPLQEAITNRIEKLPRNLVKVASSQKELLESPDSWAENLQQYGPRGMVNLPPDVLNDIKAFHLSRLLPPAGQRPASSSIPASTNASKKQEGGDLNGRKDVQDDESHTLSSPARQVSWSPSPSRRVRPDDSPPVLDKRTARYQSQEPEPSLPTLPTATTNLDSPDKQSSILSNGHVEPFLTQAPIPNLPSTSESKSSADKSSKQTETSQSQHDGTTPLPDVTTRTTNLFLQSSAGTESDELQMVIPGALSTTTPPIHKVAARVVAPQEFTNTPPCGQGGIIYSTYDESRKKLQEVAAMANAHTRSGRPSSANTPIRNKSNKMMPIKFGANSIARNTAVQVMNTPAAKITGENNSPRIRGTSSPASPIASTFPTNEPTTAREAAEPKAHAPNHTTPDITMTKIVTVGCVTPELSPRAIPEINMTDVAWAQQVAPVKASLKAPISVPELVAEEEEDPFWDNPYDTFVGAYPSFRGSMGDFVRACLSIRLLRRRRMLPIYIYDDYIRVFCGEYLRYIDGGDDEEPMSAMAWYVENVRACAFAKGLVSDKNLGRVFRVHASEYRNAQIDLGITSPSSARLSDSRMASEALSMAYVEPPGPATTAVALRMTVTPTHVNPRKRPASAMASVEDVSPEFVLGRAANQVSAESPDVVRYHASKIRRPDVESPRDASLHDSSSKRGASNSFTTIQGRRSSASDHSRPRDRLGPNTDAVPLTTGGDDWMVVSPDLGGRGRNHEGTRIGQHGSPAETATPMRGRGSSASDHSRSRDALGLLQHGAPPPNTRDEDRVAESLGPGVRGPNHEQRRVEQHESPAETVTPPYKDHATPRRVSQAMPPPQVPAQKLTANDRIKAKTRALPPGWKGESARAPTTPVSASSSPAQSVLTQGSGVRKRRKKMPKPDEYKARMEKLGTQGRLPGPSPGGT